MAARKPSNIMMQIRNLSGKSYKAMEWAMFLSQLPVPVRTSLTGSKAKSNDDLVSGPDDVAEEFQLANASLAMPHSISAVESDRYEIMAAFHPRPDPRAPKPAPRQRDVICHIHRKFGVKAYTCKSFSCPMLSLVQGNDGAGH